MSGGAGKTTIDATDALVEYFHSEIEAGLAEADRGEFASPDDLARVVAKFELPARDLGKRGISN